MPSFKRIFSIVWYAWNLRNLGQVLFVFLGGLMFLFGSAYYGSRDRLSTTPESIDLETAHQLINGNAPHYVRLAATPDFSLPIFRTGAWAPFWGNCPPDEIHEINAAEITAADLDHLLGCTVTLSGRIDIGDARTVWWPSHGASEDTRAVSLAPVKGTQETIWIKSHVAHGLHVDSHEWQSQKNFSGMLATYGQALAALPEGLATHARRALPDLPEAYVICPANPYIGESLDFFTTHYWVPVNGSDNLFLWTSVDEQSTFGASITGVLVPLALTDYQARDRMYTHFESVTGRPLPERIGVIKYKTAEAYNEKLSGYSGVFMIFGVLWTVLGLAGIILYIKAPDLIYGTWQRALRQLSLGAIPKDSNPPSDMKKRPVKVSQSPVAPETGTYSEQPGIPSLLFPPDESLDPPPEKPSPRAAMGTAFKNLWDFIPEEKEQYLAFIQDFLHPNNPGSALRLMGCHDDTEAAEATLLNSGQRHPGLALQLLAVNKAPLAGTTCLPPAAPETFEMRAYDYVVLCHAPSARLLQRVIICAVFDGLEDDSRQKAEAILEAQQNFALMGRVFMIGDSENGPCQVMIKTADSSILLPPR